MHCSEELTIGRISSSDFLSSLYKIKEMNGTLTIVSSHGLFTTVIALYFPHQYKLGYNIMYISNWQMCSDDMFCSDIWIV